jgi:hypothetical protein
VRECRRREDFRVTPAATLDVREVRVGDALAVAELERFTFALIKHTFENFVGSCFKKCAHL